MALSEFQHDRAMAKGASDVSQFWGEPQSEPTRAMGAEIESSVLENLFVEGSIYAGALGLDAILVDLAGRGVTAEDVNALISEIFRKEPETTATQEMAAER
ncbi:MAG: hypothetical protein AAFQ11_01465 [Pseudomonadota bacterium]